MRRLGLRGEVAAHKVQPKELQPRDGGITWCRGTQLEVLEEVCGCLCARMSLPKRGEAPERGGQFKRNRRAGGEDGRRRVIGDLGSVSQGPGYRTR